MMEHINIISKEAITEGLKWPPVVVGIIGILFCLAIFVVLIIKPKDVHDRCIRLMLHSLACLGLMLVTMLICTIFFPVETGKYKYAGTLDDEMSIKEYKEFEATYTNIRYEDGFWYWEDK